MNVTPVSQLVPAPVMAKVPTPEIATRTQVGTQHFVSAYLTEKVKTVLVVPVAGEAVPEVRIGSCAGPEHAPLAALVAEAASRVAMIASESAKRRTMKVPPARVESVPQHRTSHSILGTCTRSTPGSGRFAG